MSYGEEEEAEVYDADVDARDGRRCPRRGRPGDWDPFFFFPDTDTNEEEEEEEKQMEPPDKSEWRDGVVERGDRCVISRG